MNELAVNIDDIVRAKNACIYTYLLSLSLSRLTFRISIPLVLKKKKKKKTRIYLILIIHPHLFLDREYFPAQKFVNGNLFNFSLENSTVKLIIRKCGGY